MLLACVPQAATNTSDQLPTVSPLTQTTLTITSSREVAKPDSGEGSGGV